MDRTLDYLLVAVFSIVFPLGCMLWWKKRSGEKIGPFAVGALCFLLFAMFLEQISHTIFLVINSPLSRFIRGSAVAYMLYGALAAGFFEETGRLIGFKVMLKPHTEKECSVAYGIGHGGIEVVVVLGLTYLVYFLASCGVIIGNDSSNDLILGAAASIPLNMIISSMIERIFTMFIHVGLSMMVFTAAREKGKMWLYALAILLHALVDAPAALYQFGVPIPFDAIELYVIIAAIGVFLAGKWALSLYHEPMEEETT